MSVPEKNHDQIGERSEVQEVVVIQRNTKLECLRELGLT
jgi:hypothetical protein